MNTKEQNIYMAGFFDGEGCIGINKAPSKRVRDRYRVEVQINQVDRRPLVLFQERYGGTLSKHERSKKNPKWQDIWHWLISDRRAKALIKDLLPYCIVKKRDLEVALDYLSLPNFDRTPNLPNRTEEQLQVANKNNEIITMKRVAIHKQFKKECRNGQKSLV